jgi:small-conductance mechanosensitive channel
MIGIEVISALPQRTPRARRGHRTNGHLRALTLLWSLLAPLVCVSSLAEPGPTLPTKIKSGQAESIVAPLSEHEAPQLLIERLNRDAVRTANTPGQAAGDAASLEPPAGLFASSFYKLTRLTPQLPGALAEVFDSKPWRNTVSRLMWIAGLVLISILAAAAAEGLARRSLRALRKHLHNAPEKHRIHSRVGLALLQLLLETMALGLFTAVSFLTVFSLSLDDTLSRNAGGHVLTLAVLLRALHLGARFLYSPRVKGLRIVDIPDSLAHDVYKAVLRIAGSAIGLGIAAHYLMTLGLPDPLYRLCIVIVGSAAFLALIAVTWYLRRDVATALAGGQLESLEASHQGRHLVAHTWHVMASGYLLLVGLVWSTNILAGRDREAAAALFSVLVLLLVPALDKLTHAALAWIVSRHMSPEGDPEVANQTPVTKALRRAIRVVLFGVAFLALLEAWGFGISAALATESGRAVLGGLFDITVIVVLAYIAWDLCKYLTTRWIPEEDEGPALPGDGEGGGTGATRAQTLLPLLRRFILAILVVMVTMLILDKIGINIGPLIAGAGVFGLAIGFGAQKLVQDVISGAFFLIDDAFRKGEYVLMGDLRGTVEKISVRSMQLRHHRGPLHTIPYGEIQSITNHSRDYAIMKFELRVPFEADVEKVRKLIKQVGVTLSENEEYASVMLEPLKSQGVHRMDDSSFVIRCKFTTIPGKQFTIRRVAYAMIQEAFAREGIRFAPRRVVVETVGTPDSGDVLAAAGAAASDAEEAATTTDTR